MQKFRCHRFKRFSGLLFWSFIKSFLQGLLTTGYIILLSRVGERVAADMRKTLFASLIRYIFYNVDTVLKHNQAKSLFKPKYYSFFFFFSTRQDVAFFDANKTGQLVNRLTADIQEFKSSFKLVISQVFPQA